MFEAAELGRSIPKEEYRRQEPNFAASCWTRNGPSPTRPSRSSSSSRAWTAPERARPSTSCNSWLDPRWVVTRAFGPPSDEESERPEFWRYWLNLPPRGRIGFYLSSWYSRPVLDRVYRRVSESAFDQQLTRIVEFERTLTDDGALLLKFWMHLDKAGQRKRLDEAPEGPADALARDEAGVEALADVRPVRASSASTRSARRAAATRRGSSSRAATTTTGA